MSYTIIPFDKDLVAGWNLLNGPTGIVKDVGKGGYDGSVKGRPIQGKDRFGRFLNFDGSAGNYIDVNSLDAWVNGKNELTLMSIIKYTTSQTNKEVMGWW